VERHRVLTTAGAGQGLDLSMHTQLRFGHFQGLSQGALPSLSQTVQDESVFEEGGGMRVVVSVGIAATAQSARRCVMQRKRLTWRCL